MKRKTLSSVKLYEDRVGYLVDMVDPDLIVDEYHSSEFSEFITTTGGDVCKYRVFGKSSLDFALYAK